MISRSDLTRVRWISTRLPWSEERVVVGALCTLLAFLICANCAGMQQSAGKKSEQLTIRNLTKETISYSIASAISEGKTQQKTLASGAIDRFSGASDMDISFNQGGKRISYRLSTGRPYTFRYDENDGLNLYEGSHGRTDVEDLAPYVPTPLDVVDAMLMMAKVDEKDILYDLGCGDGRIVIAAAKKFRTHGVGIELDPELVAKCRAAAHQGGVEKLVEFRMEDATKTDFTKATVVTLYLLPESNELLREQLEKQLKPGARVVSHNYHIPGWESKQANFAVTRTEDGQLHEIYLYRR